MIEFFAALGFAVLVVFPVSAWLSYHVFRLAVKAVFAVLESLLGF